MLTLLGMLLGLLVTAAPATASSTILCKGFTACANAGYSNFGYAPTNYKKMWWRMYAGHNCTNYVAYRMVRAGMSATRPWSGSGDARNWGVVFGSRTNQTPTVGSVAWWSSNHVAYVQRVVDANTIIVSEDHYGGDFDWRRITRSGGGWPTGFIHLVDEALTATAPPTVVGTPQVDETLTARSGSWNQAGTTFSYQWLAEGLAISGATASTYVPRPDQVGDAFTVKVTARKSGYRTGASLSKATAATLPGTMDVEEVPVISGTPKVGATLTASAPRLSPDPASVRWAWFADGRYLSGETLDSLTLEPAHLDRVIKVVAVASRDGYTQARARSAPTAEVGPEKLSIDREPAIADNPYVGRQFSVTPAVVSPDGVTAAYQWSRDGIALPGETGSSYTPTTADPGTRLSVRISYTKPGYTTIVRDLRPKAATRSLARIYARSTERRSVTVTVRADGVEPVRGEVTLIGRTGMRKTLTLRYGRATFTADWLYAGTRPLTISYLGSFRVAARTQTKTVEVR